MGREDARLRKRWSGGNFGQARRNRPKQRSVTCAYDVSKGKLNYETAKVRGEKDADEASNDSKEGQGEQ